MVKNIGASVRRKLLDEARSTDSNFNQLLDRYFRERFLYRLSQSTEADKFILKGASVFQVWLGNPHRNTRDVDLLASGSNNPEIIKKTFEQILQQPEDDGIEFTNIKSSVLQVGQKYEGVRLDVEGKLDTAKLKLQIDIGYGQTVTPRAQKQTVPTLLDLPSPSLLIYPKETVVAEKFEAICDRGLKNSRVKDYFDLYYLQNNFEFDGKLLQLAITNTFDKRQTPIPSTTPVGLTEQYIAANASRERQWQKLIAQSNVENFPNLSRAIPQISSFITPIALDAAQKSTITKKWQPNQGWSLTNRFEKYPVNDSDSSQSQRRDLELD